MNEFEVIFYERTDGVKPAQEFLMSLDKKMRAKVSRLLEMLERNGYELREPYSKFLGDGIFELRAQADSDISRVLYFFVINKRVVITHGFIKKTQRTPKAEIERAKQCRKDYLERNAYNVK
ncbi:MAG: type II toxin-antitoxin system RelE/ParE family toxin [Synergistaceae bacterium]|nr:type II toxin-antitoxin system RelE/ParE family toxin [Synergistaceae bacterium]